MRLRVVHVDETSAPSSGRRFADSASCSRFEVTQHHVNLDSIIAEHVLHCTNTQGQAVTVPMGIVYCFDEVGKLREERIDIDEARILL